MQVCMLLPTPCQQTLSLVVLFSVKQSELTEDDPHARTFPIVPGKESRGIKRIEIAMSMRVCVGVLHEPCRGTYVVRDSSCWKGEAFQQRHPSSAEPLHAVTASQCDFTRKTRAVVAVTGGEWGRREKAQFPSELLLVAPTLGAAVAAGPWGASRPQIQGGVGGGGASWRGTCCESV